MNKLLIAAAAAVFAFAVFTSGAQAGFNVRLAAPAGFSTVEKAGCGGGYRRSYRRRYQSARRRRARRRAHIARKRANRAVSVAKAKPETKTETETASKAIESENSSISTADGNVVAKVEMAKPEEKVAAAKDVGCKQFFPSVGMTLTVSCE